MDISVALNGPKERNLTFMRGDEMTVNLIVYAMDGDTTPIAVTNLQASTGGKGYFPVGSEFTVPCGLGRTPYEIVGDVNNVRTTLVYGYIEAPFSCDIFWNCCCDSNFPRVIPTTEASNVVVQDFNEYFQSNNAEDVLQEIGLNIQALGGGNALVGSVNKPQKYTWATKPSAALNEGLIIRITDVGAGQLGNGGGTLWFSNGIRWKAVNGSATLDSIDTPNSSSGNALQNLNPNHNPIFGGVLGLYDTLHVRLSAEKSGNAANATLTLRYGPLGTIADPVISTATDMTSTNQAAGYDGFEFKRISQTQIKRLGSPSGSAPFNGASLGVPATPVTVGDMDTTTMYLSICYQLNSGTEVVTISDYTMTLQSTDS